MKRSKKKTNFVLIGILLALVIGAGAYYFFAPDTTEATAAPELQTAKVRKGDLMITASGAGNVVPAAEADLGFRSAGVISDLYVANGEAVTSAQVLARLDDNRQAEANFQALFSAQGLAQAELAVVKAKDALADAENGVIYLIGSDAWYWEKQLARPEATQEEKDYAAKKLAYFLSLRYVDESDMAAARANLETARVALLDAQTALDIIKAGAESIVAPITSIGTQTANIEKLRLAAENTRLVAPFDGSIVSLNVVKGQAVGTSPVMTIVTTNDLLVRFYLDETDIDKAVAGKPVTFNFDAYPDQPVTGEIILIEPALQTVDGTPVVVAWATLPKDAPVTVLSGMTVDAEVIAAEARDTLLVPAQALRELTPGSFAVFIVSADGQLKMTPVTVGLRDFANAEILSGVSVGDVISTGTVETK